MCAEVEAFLAKGGKIRKFAPGDSGNPICIIEWMQAQGSNVRYIGRGFARLGRRTVNLAGLIDAANEMRRQRGLEPLSLEISKTKRQFFFGTPTTAPRRPSVANEFMREPGRKTA